MTNQEKFIKAHQIAKEIKAHCSDYRTAFSLALRQINSEIIQGGNMTNEERFISLGGKKWVKDDMERVYITSKIFNAEFNDLTNLGDRNNKFFYDCKTNMLMRAYKGKKPQIEIDYNESE